MNRCLDELRRQFEEAGVKYQVVDHPLAYTAQRVADLEDVPGHSFAKSVVVFVDDRPSLLALPAPHVVDFDALCRELNARHARLAAEAEFGGLFPDCDVGAMPPFPGPAALPVYLDRAILEQPEIVFEAGSHTQSVRMRTEEYVAVARPRVLSFARESVGEPPRSR